MQPRCNPRFRYALAFGKPRPRKKKDAGARAMCDACTMSGGKFKFRHVVSLDAVGSMDFWAWSALLFTSMVISWSIAERTFIFSIDFIRFYSFLFVFIRFYSVFIRFFE